MVKFQKCNQLKTSPKREDHKKTQPLASLSFQLSNQITRSTTSGHERILQSRDCPRRIHGQRQTQNQRLCSYLLFFSCMSHLALSVGVMTESVGTDVQKLYKQKSPILRSLFFRNFIALSCESSWEDSHLHFAPCRQSKERLFFEFSFPNENSR